MKLVIIGSGGFAREVRFVIERMAEKEKFEFIGFVDNDKVINTMDGDALIVGNDEWLSQYSSEISVVFGIGNPHLRKTLIQKFSRNKNIKYPNIVAKTAILSNEIQIGQGNLFCDGVIGTIDIQIGDFNIFNLGTTIGHNTVIGNYNTFNPATNISGNVCIGELVNVGTGTKIIPSVHIGNHITIGAGTVVIKHVENNCTIVGNPARVIKRDEN